MVSKSSIWALCFSLKALLLYVRRQLKEIDGWSERQSEQAYALCAGKLKERGQRSVSEGSENEWKSSVLGVGGRKRIESIEKTMLWREGVEK